MDTYQSSLHTLFALVHYLGDPDRLYRVMEWITFYKRNINRFAENYLGLKLHLYQHICLFLMNIHPSFCIVASRATAKSYIIAIYACCRAILYPGSKIVIGSATKGQSKLIVSEKIKRELMRESTILCMEIDVKNIIDNQNDVLVPFFNGSTIKVVPANENARGNRGTVFVYEEFRQIPKKIIDSVFSPFLIIRQAPFLSRPEYEDKIKELQEEPVEIFISSSWFQSHWMWNLMKLFMKEKYENDSACVMCMDYAISLRHNIKTKKQLLKDKKKFDPMTWAIEYENQMIAQNAHAYFSYDMLTQNQKLVRAFYPRINADYVSKIKNKYAIPKQEGEIRIISCDIAMVEGSANDNSVYSCIRLLPEKMKYSSSDTTGARVEIKQGFRRQVPYLEAVQGGHTEKQAIRIKQLYEDFDADYCVLDVKAAGISVYDALAKVLYDEDRDVEYKPWACMNDDDTANRIQIAGALPVVFVVNASARLNSEIAVSMRECLTNKKIDLLVNHNDAIDEIVKRVPEYSQALDLDVQLFYEHPFLETTAFIGEMLTLEYEKGEQTGYIKIKEPPGMRKDRYTSISYGNYFAGLLERDMLFDNSDYEFLALYN